MVVLITISAILVIAAVAAAIFTSHDLDALKKEIVKLEKTQNRALKHLDEIEAQRESLEGTRSLLEKVKSELQERRGQLLGRMDELDDEQLPEVKTNLPQEKPLDFDESASLE